MPKRPPLSRRVATAARWPVGVALTSWRYMWRTTPVHRWELTGSLPEDAPPSLPPDVDGDEIQSPDEGAGPLMHRLYRVRVRNPQLSAEALIERIAADLNAVAPRELASFEKVEGDAHELAVNDEFVVRMPAPWDGPVRVASVTSTSFRLATLEGHLEAGQIEFRAAAVERVVEVVIESWARSADRLSNLLYARARMAKEVQLYIWTSVLERIVRLAGGVRDGGIVVTTRRVDEDDGDGGTGPQHRRARRRLAALATTSVNYDAAAIPHAGGDGWHLDDMIEPLPREPSGPPLERGSWRLARDLMVRYQVADPRRVRATYRPGTALAGRDMLLTVRYAGVRFRVGVRVGDVYEETRRIDGREARVFGWDYRTLEGHFEQGQMHYEVWKWLDTGGVEFRVRAVSRMAESGPLLPRLGFRLLGRAQQLAFYRRACRRMRRLTESQLETERTSAGHTTPATVNHTNTPAPY